MILDKEALRKILTQKDMRLLGYYIALKMDGIKRPAEMAEITGLSSGVCRIIEKQLVELGLLHVRGIGRGRVVNFPDMNNEDAVALLEFFASRIGREILTYSQWYRSQLAIATELVNELGYDMSVWMVEYILTIQKMNMYSLNLVKTMACELKPKYEQFLVNREKIKKQKDLWDNITDVKIEKNKEDVDLSTLLDYGIKDI